MVATCVTVQEGWKHAESLYRLRLISSVGRALKVQISSRTSIDVLIYTSSGAAQITQAQTTVQLYLSAQPYNSVYIN